PITWIELPTVTTTGDGLICTWCSPAGLTAIGSEELSTAPHVVVIWVIPLFCRATIPLQTPAVNGPVLFGTIPSRSSLNWADPLKLVKIFSYWSRAVIEIGNDWPATLSVIVEYVK